MYNLYVFGIQCSAVAAQRKSRLRKKKRPARTALTDVEADKKIETVKVIAGPIIVIAMTMRAILSALIIAKKVISQHPVEIAMNSPDQRSKSKALAPQIHVRQVTNVQTQLRAAILKNVQVTSAEARVAVASVRTHRPGATCAAGEDRECEQQAKRPKRRNETGR